MQLSCVLMCGAVLACLVASAVPTIIIGSGVSASAAAAVGLSAVLGLKAVALAGLAAHRAVGGRRHHGYGGRHSGRRHQHRRGRRDASDLYAEQEAQEYISSAYFDMIDRMDSKQCALKVVCELYSRESAGLSEDEQLILTIFGVHPEAPAISFLRDEDVSPRDKYQLAAFVGDRGNSIEQCISRYNKCPFSTEVLMRELEKAV